MLNHWRGPLSVQHIVTTCERWTKNPFRHHHRHHHHRPITTAVTSYHRTHYEEHANTSTMAKQQHIYFICRSEYIQFGHCSDNGALRGWDTSSKVWKECINILDSYLLCQPLHTLGLAIYWPVLSYSIALIFLNCKMSCSVCVFITIKGNKI